MAFKHFHKHSRKYLLFSLLAIMFTMVTFNITSALTSFASSVFGGSSGAHLVFKTSGGREIGTDQAGWQAATVEIPPARGVFLQTQGYDAYDPYAGITNDADLALAHLILLADAEEMKIEMPPERAVLLLDGFKRTLHEQYSRRGVQLKVSDFSNMLARMRLTEERLKVRLLEILKVEAYVRAVKGVRVHDPERMLQLFVDKNVEVGLEAVEFPFEKYAAELKADPPADDVLEAWFKALPADTIQQKYSRGQRFTIDLVAVDGDAWDPASLPADVLPVVADPTDDEAMHDVKGDPKRYLGDGAVPEKAEQISAEVRAKLKQDRQLKALLEKARTDFDAALATLPPPAAPPADVPKLPDGSPDPAAVEAQKKSEHDDRVAKETEAFAQIVAKYGLPAVQTFVDQEAKQLAALDPPNDAAMQYIAPGLLPPGRTGGGLHTQSTLPARERKWAYIVRLADEPKAPEALPFAEAKSPALEQWIEENAKKRAMEKAKALTDALLAEAEKMLPAPVVAAFQAQRDTDLKNAAQAGADPASPASEAEHFEQEYYFNVQSALHGTGGARFAEIARSLGLEVKAFAPQRKSVSNSWYFNDRFSGAERFLFRQDDDSHGPALLAFAEGIVSRVLESDADKAAYVARVSSRRIPTIADMTPKDRQEIEAEEAREWAREDRALFGMPRPAYENPFSIAQILRRNEPKFRTQSASTGGGGGYGYGY